MEEGEGGGRNGIVRAYGRVLNLRFQRQEQLRIGADTKRIKSTIEANEEIENKRRR